MCRRRRQRTERRVRDRFARTGARLAADVDAAGARALAELVRLGSEAVALDCDVRDEAACIRAIASVVERFGCVDVLVNNAGLTHRSAFADTDTAVLRRVMDVNFFGAVHCTKKALPSLVAQHGLVVAISSIAGLAPLYGRTGYAASKHAIQGFFASLRSELAPRGVDVLIVCPGFTATGIGVHALDADGQPTKHPQSTVGRVATPESVAEAVYGAAERSQRLLVLSTVGRVTWWLQRLSPALCERVMARSLRHELERT